MFGDWQCSGAGSLLPKRNRRHRRADCARRIREFATVFWRRQNRRNEPAQSWPKSLSRSRMLKPCMLKKGQSAHLMETAVGKLAKRSGARFPTATGGRSSCPGSNKTVGELDRRRSHEISPNSRKSRGGVTRRASSHSQGRDIVMDVAFKSFVGIDIAKRTLDVHVLPERTSLKQSNDSKGRATTPRETSFSRRVFDRRRSHRRLRAGPRCRTDRRGLSRCGRQPPASTRLRQSLWQPGQDRSHRCGRVGTLRPGRRAAHPEPKSRKNSSNCKTSSLGAGNSSICEPQK